jgi:carbon-monoxide dehydrogenase medium subunit
MPLPLFQFCEPDDIEEACALLAEAGGSAAVIAGGTDLLVKMKRGMVSPELVVSISRLREDTVRGGNGTLIIDSQATMTELGDHRELRGTFRSIAEGALAIGSPQIRNRATVGGNLVSARPCADTAPPLLCWGARINLRSAGGGRTLELNDFFQGPGKTSIRPGEILTSIELDRPEEPSGGAFLKLIRRATLEITIVSAAATIVLEGPGGVVRDAGIVLGSVAPVPLRARTAEDRLRGEKMNDRSIARAAAEAAKEARPIDDHRGGASYRRAMVEVLVRRALEMAHARAGAGR